MMTRFACVTSIVVVLVILAAGCTSGSTQPTATVSNQKPGGTPTQSAPRATAATSATAPAAKQEPKATEKPAEGSAQAILDALANLPAAERQQKLEEGARKEGKVVAYVVGDIEMWEALKRNFQQKYPYLTMDYLRASSEELLDRELAEYRAGKLGGDFLMNSKSYILVNEGMVIPYTSPAKEAIPEKFRGPLYTVEELNPIVIAYNTNLVKPQDAPKSWEDLLDAKWKGRKMAMDFVPDVMMIAMYERWGVDRGREYLRKLVAQDLVPTRSHTTAMDQLAAGEFPIEVEAYGYRAIQMVREKRAPLAWAIPDPIGSPLPHEMIAKTTTRPHATALFYDYMQTAEAGTVIAASGRIPVQPGAQMKFPDDQRPILEAKELLMPSLQLYEKLYDTVVDDLKTIVQPALGG